MSKQSNKPCNFPGCASLDAKRIDIPTNHFRGDDVVLNVCKEHRKTEHTKALLSTDKAKRQMA